MLRYTTPLVHNLTIKTSCVSFYTSSLALLLVSAHGPQWRTFVTQTQVVSSQLVP